MIIKDHKLNRAGKSQRKKTIELATPEDSMMESEEQQPFFKVTKYEKDPEIKIAREAISHDQFLNPKPEFLAKLERQQA